jgi:hypothetical protein
MDEVGYLVAVQRLYDDLPRWRIVARFQTRRLREESLQRLAAKPPEPKPSGEAPLLRGV